MTATAIRLVISDIDGTLVRGDKSLADATVAAFARLYEAGCAATLISARGPSGMAGLAEALGITLPLGAFNGGTIFDVGGVIGTPARLDADVVRTLIGLTPGGLDMWLFADGHWYAPNAGNLRVPREKLSSCLMPTLVSDFAGITGPADKIVFVSEDVTALRRLEAEVRTAVGTQATIALSQPYFLDITALAANKGDGVAALVQLAGVPLAQVAVIGDMANDLPMFARAGLSIAMGQAPESVRSAADFTCASNEDDGVAQTIERYILPRVVSA